MAINFNSLNSPPGFGSNSSNSRPNFGFQDDAKDLDQFLWNDFANSGQNQVNGNALISSQPFVGNNSCQPHHHQNDQRSQISSVGQLGLKQRVGETTRRASHPASAPRRVHVHSLIDCSLLQNQPGVTEVTVTEVVRTQFLTATSTMDRLLAPNDDIMNPSGLELGFPQRSLLLSSQLSQPPLTETETLDGIYRHNRSQNQSINPPNTTSHMSTNHADHSKAKSVAIDLDPLLMRASVSEIKPQANPYHNQAHRCQALLEEFYRNQLRGLGAPSRSTRVASNKMKLPRETRIGTSGDDDDDDEQSGDGRIHSLPRTKDSPYTCPKCKKVVPTSQLFAAHVSSAHYKHETFAQRKRRFAARFKNKRDLRLLQSSDGLTIVPNESSSKARWKKKVESAIRSTKAIEVRNISGKAAVEGFLLDVLIKKEHYK